MTQPFDLTDEIVQHWLANHPVLLLVTEEPYRVTAAVEAAVERLTALGTAPVRAWSHDKVCGFHQGSPGIRPPQDRRSHALTVALPMMLEPLHVMRQASADNVPPFDPREDILFVLKDVHWDWSEGPSRPSVIQILRNCIQANMASPHYWLDEADEPLRGKRMLVLVSPLEDRPADLPEIDPLIVPLPDDAMLERALADTLDPAVGQTNAAGQTNRELSAPERTAIVGMGRGFTYQKWEEALALALVANGGYNDVGAFLRTLSRAKGAMLAGIGELNDAVRRAWQSHSRALRRIQF